MIDARTIKEALCSSISVTQLEDGVRVTTHCLYPSNGTVTVTIRPGLGGYIVGDDRGATSEAWSCGLATLATDKQIRPLLKSYGLHVNNGEILSPPVGENELAAAILLVANAAKDVADWSLAHLRERPKRNFKAELASLLERHFHGNLKHLPIVGLSNRQYNFDHVVLLSNDRRLIIDAVVNDPSSINSRVVANLDVRMVNDVKIEQLIVYDDDAPWSSSDLKVLEVGARTVPFSNAEREIKRLAA